MEYIPIEKEQIPYQFDIDLGGKVYTFEINYNMTFDFFTVDLYLDEQVLALGSKMVYGVPLFEGVETVDFPVVLIRPFDEAGQEQTVSWDNLGVSVFLYYGEESDNE